MTASAEAIVQERERVKEEKKRAKQEVMAVAMAAIDRLGKESPANVFSCDTNLLRNIFEEFVLRHPVVEDIASAATAQELLGLVEKIGWLENDELAEAIKLGLIEALSKAMLVRFGGERCVVVAYFSTIESIGTKNLELRELVAEHGCIAAIVSAMRTAMKDGLLLTSGCSILARLAFRSRRNVKAISASGGIEVTVEALRAHNDLKILQNPGCHLLANVATQEHRTKIVKLGGIELIIQSMKMFQGDVGVQARGAGALGNLAGQTDKGLVSELGGISVILDAMENHPTKQSLQELCCIGLWGLLSTEEQLARWLTPRVTQAVTSACTAFPLSKILKFCTAVLDRTESPAATMSREKGCCTRVFAPMCKESCPSRASFLCLGCSIVQTMFTCKTCAGSTTDNFPVCESCFAIHHSKHTAFISFKPGGCSCLLTECKEEK